MQAIEILNEVFWYSSFREWQEDIINSVSEWNDTMVFMPTGWWKSITYQVPWLVRDWLALIISPLISLMKDQVDVLVNKWVDAELLNSTVSPAEKQYIFQRLSMENCWWIKFLYIAPERLLDKKFLDIIKQVKIALVAVDEAHCISQWGHDFRPSYMKIKDFLDELRSVSHFPVMALTATATQRVKKDIQERLWLTKFNSFTKWFDRKNIILIVREISKKEEKLSKVQEIINKTTWVWIIYCSSIKKVQEVYEYLISKNIPVWKYTGDMPTRDRELVQNKFMADEYKAVVATNAFWMWIDKSDIRFVIHYNLPWNIESYYQEVWRWWRDWKLSYWIVLASYWDTRIQEFFIDSTYPKAKEVLDLYDYLYEEFPVWWWANHPILKTQKVIATESWLDNDMKVWSCLRVLEKYDILKKWINSWITISPNFRWKGITLLKPKVENKIDLNIDWQKENELKLSSYDKLDKIKRMLFYPSCRKRFILEYFSDTEDLKTLWDNCWACEYCIEKKNMWKNSKNIPLKLSLVEIALDTVDYYSNSWWLNMIVDFLFGSKNEKILSRKMDLNTRHWSLKEMKKPWIKALIQALINVWYITQSDWQYPMLIITDEWKQALRYGSVEIKEILPEITDWYYSYLPKNIARSNSRKPVKKTKATKKDKIWTLDITFKYLQEWLSLKQISKKRDLAITTVEEHIIKLFIIWKIEESFLKKLVDKEKIKILNKIFKIKFPKGFTYLRDVKNILDKEWIEDIDFFDIRVARILYYWEE